MEGGQGQGGAETPYTETGTIPRKEGRTPRRDTGGNSADRMTKIDGMAEKAVIMARTSLNAPPKPKEVPQGGIPGVLVISGSGRAPIRRPAMPPSRLNPAIALTASEKGRDESAKLPNPVVESSEGPGEGERAHTTIIRQGARGVRHTMNERVQQDHISATGTSTRGPHDQGPTTSPRRIASLFVFASEAEGRN